MNILQIIPNLGAGGAEQAVVDMNAALIKAGAQSFVVSAGGHRVATIAEAGGTHIQLAAASKNPLTILANGHRLTALIKHHKIDVIHARSRAPAWSAWLAAQQTGCGFVTTFHAAYAYGSRVKKAYNRIMTRGHRIIAISDFIAHHIAHDYAIAPHRIARIHRGVDMAQFEPSTIAPHRLDNLRSLWRLTPQHKIILLPARLSRIKGQTLLIEAMRLLQQQGDLPDDVVAVIIGSDQGRNHYSQELLEKIIGYDLRSRVVLAEHCDDMPAAYALANMVVVPSLVPEGFGRVPVEAQAMGVPVIASDLGAMRETIIANETGWLVPPDDPAALAADIMRVLHLPILARHDLAKQAMAHVRQHFDLQNMSQQTLAVYHEVMAAHKGKQSR